MKDKINKMIEPVVLSMGYEFWGLIIGQQNNDIKFTLYIDSDNGVNIEDCEKVSNQVKHIIDTEEFCNLEYVLEVSSPGFDRILITHDHFKKYLNEKVRMRLKWLVNNRKNINGTIKSANAEYVIINENSESYEIKYDSIESARLKI